MSCVYRGKWALPCWKNYIKLRMVKLEAGTDCCCPSVLLGVFHAWQLPVSRRPAGESGTLIEVEEAMCSGAMPQTPSPPFALLPWGAWNCFVCLCHCCWKLLLYTHIHIHLHNYEMCVIYPLSLNDGLPLGLAHYMQTEWVIFLVNRAV